MRVGRARQRQRRRAQRVDGIVLGGASTFGRGLEASIGDSSRAGEEGDEEQAPGVRAWARRSWQRACWINRHGKRLWRLTKVGHAERLPTLDPGNRARPPNVFSQHYSRISPTVLPGSMQPLAYRRYRLLRSYRCEMTKRCCTMHTTPVFVRERVEAGN